MREIKNFNIRIPKETWLFLKKTAMEQERSMVDIIMSCVDKYKRKCENKLTGDTHVE